MFFLRMRVVGFEPTSLSTGDFKSPAFAISPHPLKKQKGKSVYLMDFPFVKLPADAGLRPASDLHRTLRQIEGQVDVRIRHEAAIGEPGDRVIDQCGHDFLSLEGFIIWHVFSAKKKNPGWSFTTPGLLLLQSMFSLRQKREPVYLMGPLCETTHRRTDAY